MSQLAKILEAREERTALRLAFSKNKTISISLSFNIPGTVKSNPEINKAFKHTVLDLERFLLAGRIFIQKNNRRQRIDAAGDFYIAPISNTDFTVKEIKSYCEEFEQQHFLGRIIDVDLLDQNGKMISSGKQKKCFICNEAAVRCMKTQKHSQQDLVDFIGNRINAFLEQKISEDIFTKIPAYATQALLYELSLSPKPGLVDKISSGSHNDMDFFSFLNSTAILSSYWSKLIALAKTNSEQKGEGELRKIRLLGIEMEEKMFDFTHNVNTHKGAIFIIGMLVYASSRLLFENKELSSENIRRMLRQLNTDTMNDAYLKHTEKLSNGQQIFRKYGKDLGGGIRKEMTLGLPIVFDHALPILKAQPYKNFMLKERSLQKVLMRCLVQIMAHNNDSTILHRSDDKILAQLKQKSAKCLEDNNSFDKHYEELCTFCSKHHISPGGSADLLSAVIFIYQLQNNF